MLTPVNSQSYNNLQLNAGIIVVGVDMSTFTNAAAARTAIKAKINTEDCLGATKGGGTFNATPETRKIELDGVRYGFKGDTVVDSWAVQLSGTMMEITKDNIVRAFPSATATTKDKLTTIKLRTDIENTDYIDKIVWVGDTKFGLMAIELKNALNTSGVSFTFADKSENGIPFEFEAHQDDVNDSDYAPFAIYLLED